MIISIQTLIQLTTLLVLPLTILILNIQINFYFKKRNKKIARIEINNLTLEKSVIICLQFLIFLLYQQTKSTSYVLFSLILLLHFIICISFLIKSNEKIKIWNNLFNFKFIILITIICLQLLLLAWEGYNTKFANNNDIFWVISFYIIFLFMIFKTGNQTLLISKYLIFNTYKILITKKNNNFYFKQKKIFDFYSKVEAITNLWNFENLKNTKQMNLTNIEEKTKKIIRNNWIIFIIACNNLLCKNIIKTQKIIINGWKNSLIE